MDVRIKLVVLYTNFITVVISSCCSCCLTNAGNQIETYGKFDNCSFGNFYSNLQNLTDVSLRRLANDTVKLYCANDVVDGIQVDLEPYRGIYQKPLSKYVGYLSEFMRDENKTTGACAYFLG